MRPRLRVAAKTPQPFSTLPPFARHCFSLIDIQPWPLQAFFPLHPFLADEHSLFPLQALTPAHCTLASSAFAGETTTDPLKNRLTAAAAMAAPEYAFTTFLLLEFIFGSCCLLVN
jgi:hypothetical protein